MASRTSVYTNALKLPDWVLGGEFGDLSKIMNSRDISYENVAQEEQLTEQNDLNLEREQRKERTREILNDRMGTTRPTDIGQAYDEMIKAAYEAGDPMAAMEYETKRQAYENAQLAKRRSDVAGAIGLADNLGFDRVEELYPGVLTKDDYNRNQAKKKVGSEKTFPMYNTETKRLDPSVPYSEAMRRQESGKWIFTKDPTFDDGGLNLSGVNPSPSGSNQSILGRAYDYLLGGKPGDAQVAEQKSAVEDLKDAAPAKGAEKTREDGGAVDIKGPPRPPKPGMKWQQNKKTGEYREVPK